MKMTQTEISAGRPSIEIFYDGQLRVDYSGKTFGVVEIPRQKVHWRDELLMRGYRDVVEQPEVAPTVEEPTPAPKSRRKKVSDGASTE